MVGTVNKFGRVTKRQYKGRKVTSVNVKAVVPRKSQVAKIPLRYLPKSIRPETKKFDAYYNNTAIDTVAGATASQVFPLCNTLAQGDDNNKRVGDKIFLKNIVVKMYAYASTAVTDSNLRVMLVEDTKPSQATAGTSPVVSDILATIGGDTTRDMLSPLRLDNGGRFRIHRQKIINSSLHIAAIASMTSGSATSESTIRFFTFKMRPNKRIYYENSHNNPCSGSSFYIVAVSDVHTSNLPRLGVVSRIYYSDN